MRYHYKQLHSPKINLNIVGVRLASKLPLIQKRQQEDGLATHTSSHCLSRQLLARAAREMQKNIRQI